MPKILDRCVAKVRAKNRKTKKKVNPWAVCSTSTGIKRKKGGGWTRGKKSKKKS